MDSGHGRGVSEDVIGGVGGRGMGRDNGFGVRESDICVGEPWMGCVGVEERDMGVEGVCQGDSEV